MVEVVMVLGCDGMYVVDNTHSSKSVSCISSLAHFHSQFSVLANWYLTDKAQNTKKKGMR